MCLGEAGRKPSSDDRRLSEAPIALEPATFYFVDLTPIIFFICLLKLLNDDIRVVDLPGVFFESYSAAAAARAISSESAKPEIPACTDTLPNKAFFARD